MIPFSKPCVIGEEMTRMEAALQQDKLSGNGVYSKACTNWLEQELPCKKALLTPSCTAALEMAALLTEVKAGDEVIMPSFTFVSTANAFALRGAVIRFVDVDPATKNIDPEAIAAAINERTKVIVVVHYAGVACDMDGIMALASKHQLWVVEDAAQALGSTYRNQALGTIGHFGTFSFHDTKNITCGEGGALTINHEASIKRAEILQEKGTNRTQFVNGKVDKYTWKDIGSSYLLSELNAAYLSVQLEQSDEINANRMNTWKLYEQGFAELAAQQALKLPVIPDYCIHNAHMFYVETETPTEAEQLLHHLQAHDITAVTHYVPLHSSDAGRKFGVFHGEDRYTSSISQRLIRLPLYYDIAKEDVEHVIKSIQVFYNQ
ncbi:dTDP-4-amino-4,6-dideoxygalactose transaminase [Ornithinibacillus gellani]|uniref:dTDP-4-amino-4,6-dideoxygalactose transaminase n=1 Tax=Ornithinibacillus gellani TaxID=2293253 RepID=UPI000F476C76|nr:dTDP-4-amino-4,6-dideoxygalactose transaminase [Ornithinibacillus gellani]TQS70581.1 dTDP-4-amino-4,6-dideoxygalactose transaminase [Ornithinibacillus gellani]